MSDDPTKTPPPTPEANPPAASAPSTPPPVETKVEPTQPVADTPASQPEQPKWVSEAVNRLMHGDEPAPETKPNSEAPAVEAKPTTETKPPEAKSPETKPDEWENDDVPIPEAEQIPAERLSHALKSTQGRLKKAVEQAQFGKIATKIANEHGVTPEQLSNWITLGCRFNKGDPQAIDALRKIVGTPAPTATPTPEVPAVTPEQIYKDHFADKVANLDMSEESAKAAAKSIAAKYSPALSQPQTRPPTQQPPTPPTQQVPQFDPLIAAAKTELDSREAALAKVYGTDFPAINAEAVQLIQARHKGAHPVTWLSHYEQAVREVVAKRAKPADPRTAPSTPAVRPSATSTPGATSDWKAAAVQKLMSGGLN